MGKTTYEIFTAFWPVRTRDGFADRINQLPKCVVSHSLQKAGWNNSHILHDVAKDIAALKKTNSGDIVVFGNATLAKVLLHHDLIDEPRLVVFPISIRSGTLCIQIDNR